ncbi:FAD:protein FMN transferase [Aliikangiella marina]|uniref:FAD:protein FMN transferase n=2 Tax=Aliikangiella marina TaxID=1712262 RepID=A0A545TK23_9GAMM|nr:FAD:protein FMN transferase [Aliikangiella marina]
MNCVQAQWHSHDFNVMGTAARVELESNDPEQAKALIQAVVAEMNRIDQQMSPYKATSELSLINREAAKGPLKISNEMYQILALSNRISAMTQGSFDISYSSVGFLYDYRNNQKPSERQIEQLKDAINYKKIKLTPQDKSVEFLDKRVKIDLGGIAKGLAVDNCIKILQQAGIKNAYVNAGGDSRLIGRKNDRLWYIGIRHPRDESKLLTNLPLEDVALSTSGDYERFFEENGVRYHHIIDPQTGDSAREIRSATILANDSITADALSTSVFVMGVKDGMALINSLDGVSAIVVDKNGKLFLSTDMQAVE